MRGNTTHSRIYIIAVIYNRLIDEIRSLPQFEALTRRYPETGLIVTDNSTDETVLERNRETASHMEWIRYIECGGNAGLSRAYNRALATIPQDEDFWVMLSDDDTFFSMEYLENACRRIRKERRAVMSSGTADTEKCACSKNHGRRPLKMLCGVVLTDGGWISPRSRYTKELAFSCLLKKPKPGIYRDLYPVNSGLFLDGSLLRETGGFDERLFLDQVDFLMMDRLRARGVRRIGVLPGEIRQTFSGEIRQISVDRSSKGSQSPDERWKIFKRDFETYCDLTGKPWCYRTYILGRRRLMLFIQKIRLA